MRGGAPMAHDTLLANPFATLGLSTNPDQLLLRKGVRQQYRYYADPKMRASR